MGKVDDARCAGTDGAEEVGGGGDDLGRFRGNALENLKQRCTPQCELRCYDVRSQLVQRYAVKLFISQCAYSFLSAHIHMSRATH